MIRIIYPKGSIIEKKSDKKQYCIVDIKEDGYEVIDYPFGVQGTPDENFIKYEDVGTLYFWGYMGEEYKEEISKVYKKIIMGGSNDK